MLILIIFAGVPFSLFLWGLVLSREFATDKERKTGKILIIISIAYLIISLGICGVMIPF